MKRTLAHGTNGHFQISPPVWRRGGNRQTVTYACVRHRHACSSSIGPEVQERHTVIEYLPSESLLSNL